MLLTKKAVWSLIILMIFGMISSSAFAVTETSETSKQINPADIQKALTEAGFYKGTIDGVIGAKTKAALRKFQEANNLKIDGVCGQKTWEKLKTYLEETPAADAAKKQKEEEIATTTPAVDETKEDYGYSEYDATGSAKGSEDSNGGLKQKLVS